MPRKGDHVFIAPSANVLGDVKIGARSSIWYGAVLRGELLGRLLRLLLPALLLCVLSPLVVSSLSPAVPASCPKPTFPPPQVMSTGFRLVRTPTYRTTRSST